MTQDDYVVMKRSSKEKLINDLKRIKKEYALLKEEHSKCTRKYWQEKCAEHHIQEKLYKDRIDKAIHRIQLLQMDGEVTIKDLGLIVRDLRGDSDD